MLYITFSGKKLAVSLVFIVAFTVTLSIAALKTFSILSNVVIPTGLYVTVTLGAGFIFVVFASLLIGLLHSMR